MEKLLAAILGESDEARLVAFGRAGDRAVGAFRTDIWGAVAYLSAHMPAGRSLLMAFENDRYAFAVALLGAWTAGIPVVLPPNTRPETVAERMRTPEVGLMAHDGAFEDGWSVRTWLEDASRTRDKHARRRWACWSHNATIATLYSSGSRSAEPTAVPKTAGQLLGEARVLAASLFPPGARVVATVRPGHIYGLLYSVLAPWMCGGAFMRETPFFPQSVARALREQRADVLVSVPAHLHSLTDLEPKDVRSLSRVVSSTAPLRGGTDAALYAKTGRSITEVLGSSETGGMAYRHRPSETRWTPLEGVQLTAGDDGRLLVDSPFLSPDTERPYRSDERVVFEGTSFTHLGRMDGIVKIGGRRLSLHQMQTRVMAVRGIEDAALVAENTDRLHGKRLLLAVVGVGVGREDILRALSEYYEPSVLPRRIVFVPNLPREANGKLQQRRLRALFLPNKAPHTHVWTLAWLRRWSEPTPASDRPTSCYLVDVPANHGAFEGHFEGHPLMAAAVQIDQIIVPALEKTFGKGRIRRIERMKFTSEIHPEDRLNIRVQGPSNACRIAIFSGESLCSSSRVYWEVRV